LTQQNQCWRLCRPNKSFIYQPVDFSI
jgi:hypothetical protein